MSRPVVAKSRADKGVKPPPVVQTPVVSHEIVAGKMNDHDWNMMVDRDTCNDFIEDIVDHLIVITLDRCFQLYIAKQLIPFTVTQVKEAISTIVEWQFLSRDEGDKNPESNSGWLQEEEPDLAETDCWAQGSVPKKYIPHQLPEYLIEEVFENEILEEDFEQITEKKDVVVDKENHVLEGEDTDKIEVERFVKEEKAKTETEQWKKKKHYSGPIQFPSEQTMMTQEMSASMPPSPTPKQLQPRQRTIAALCHSILKVPYSRSLFIKGVEYDDYGNACAIVKLNPDRLPNDRVTVTYQVIDPAIEAACARLDALKKGKSITLKPKQQKPKKKKTSENLCVGETSANVFRAMTPLPSPMIETLELTPGVTMKERGKVKHAPKLYVQQVEMLNIPHHGLTHMSTQQITPKLQVSDFLDAHSPSLRPFHDSVLLPPITAIPHSSERQISQHNSLNIF